MAILFTRSTKPHQLDINLFQVLDMGETICSDDPDLQTEQSDSLTDTLSYSPQLLSGTSPDSKYSTDGC